MPCILSPSITTSEPMFSSAILRKASYTVSSGPTEWILFPLSRSNCLIVVIVMLPQLTTFYVRRHYNEKGSGETHSHSYESAVATLLPAKFRSGSTCPQCLEAVQQQLQRSCPLADRNVHL